MITNKHRGLSSLNIIKHIKKSEILSLLKFFEESNRLKNNKELNDVNVLYEFYKSHFMDAFIPEVVLAYIYAYSPVKHPKLPKLRLDITIIEMICILNKYDIYNIKSIGNSKEFKSIGKLDGLEQLQSRDEIWKEAIKMKSFLKAYRFWPKQWQSTRGIYYTTESDKKLILAIRKIDYRYIVIEALGRDGEIISQDIMDSIQRRINEFLSKNR